MHDFSGADGSQIAVALVRQHDLVRTGSLQPRGGGRGASVSHLHVAHIEVVISKHRAADRTYQDGLILQIQVFESFGDQFVGDPVAASRTVVSLVLEVGFAFVFGIEQLRLGVDDLEAVLAWRGKSNDGRRMSKQAPDVMQPRL